MPMRTPEPRSPRSPRTTKQPISTNRTGMMLVWPSEKLLRTGRDSMSKLIVTGAASSPVRRDTRPGRARATTRPRATTSSSVPRVHAMPRLCSAERARGLRTSPANGVPVNVPVSYSEPATCSTPLSPIQVSRSVSRSPGGCRSTAAACLIASIAATSQRSARAVPNPLSAVPAAAPPCPPCSAFATPRRPSVRNRRPWA